MQELQEAVEEIRDEEEEYMENMPENLQGSERYEIAEAAVDALSSAVDWFDNADIDELTSSLEEAKGE